MLGNLDEPHRRTGSVGFAIMPEHEIVERTQQDFTPISGKNVLSSRLRKFDDVLGRFREGDSGEKLFEINSGELPLEGLGTLRVVVLKAEQVVLELAK